MGEEIPKGGSSRLLSPISIFLFVVTLQLLDQLLDHLRKRGLRSKEQIQLRQEINQLLKEASSLSSPSTFAHAAKLRRIAAAKEKELIQSQQGIKEEKCSYELYTRALIITKVVLYLCLVWKYWGVPVTAVSQELLQPFGKVLSWRAGNPATGLVTVGIVPWLVLTSRVGKFLCHKLSTLIPH